MANHISYKKLYFHLFRAMARASEYMEQGNIILAYECLLAAQKEAESACMDLDILPEQ